MSDRKENNEPVVYVVFDNKDKVCGVVADEETLNKYKNKYSRHISVTIPFRLNALEFDIS